MSQTDSAYCYRAEPGWRVDARVRKIFENIIAHSTNTSERDPAGREYGRYQQTHCANFVVEWLQQNIDRIANRPTYSFQTDDGEGGMRDRQGNRLDIAFQMAEDLALIDRSLGVEAFEKLVDAGRRHHIDLDRRTLAKYQKDITSREPEHGWHNPY